MSFLSKVCPCAFGDDDKLVPVVPNSRVPLVQAGEWTFVNSGAVDFGTDSFGKWYFEFPTATPGIHGVVQAPPSTNRGAITLLFYVAVSEGAKFIDVEGSAVPCKVRLFIQRRGDDWSGAGAFASYRFYSGPLDLTPGDGQLTVPLSPEVWTNVYGQQDAAGFAAVLADLERVGFGLGANAAMHGVFVDGSARFTVKEYTLI